MAQDLIEPHPAPRRERMSAPDHEGPGQFQQGLGGEIGRRAQRAGIDHQRVEFALAQRLQQGRGAAAGDAQL